MNPITEQIMNDIEKDKLIAFNEDRIMFEAVKKYLLVYLAQGVATPGKPLVGNVNYALQLAWDRQGGVMSDAGKVVAFTPRTDAELGADLRALARGVNIIESGFRELADMKRPEVVDVKNENPAV